MNRNESAEIVIIGGGVVGASIASYLAQDGHDVALIETGESAWGTSRRCEGHICTYDTAPGYYSKFCKLAQDMFYEMAPTLDYDIQFEPIGIGLLVDNEADMESLLVHAKGKQEEGIPCTLWDRSELLQNEPNISDTILACLNFTNDASLNPMRLAFALEQNARKHTAKFHPRTKVMGITVKDNTLQSVETDQGSIRAKKVILAAGVWTSLLADMMNLNVPIRPRQGMILVTERVEGLFGQNYVEYGYLAAKGGEIRPSATPDMEQFGVAATFEPSHDGTLLMGSSRRFVGFDTNPHPAVIQAMAQRSISFFPKLKDVRLLRTYAGLRPCSPDGKPIISNTHINGVYVASGHEGNGISLSLITGKLMAQIMAGETPFVDISPLHIDRFKCNPLTQNTR